MTPDHSYDLTHSLFILIHRRRGRERVSHVRLFLPNPTSYPTLHHTLTSHTTSIQFTSHSALKFLSTSSLTTPHDTITIPSAHYSTPHHHTTPPLPSPHHSTPYSTQLHPLLHTTPPLPTPTSHQFP
ncbi:hypothetical protein Pmani_009437 [Petrolisthes manimaculis]|uniref:Uncharacterized protein n=1 Tax=Petrolisthes manimaculis TaxID=1843537 RepID=A0AAE1UIE6_9EUCA|nr:hypothetical protein Pmani_009437 [Petrolisthes manimaculis]